MISEFVKLPESMDSSKDPNFFDIEGYEMLEDRSISASSAVSAILKVSESSRNRIFSAGM